MAKLYFKWDGDFAIRALIGVTMIQLLVVLDGAIFIMRLFFERNITKDYIGIGKWLIALSFFVLLIYNQKKYKGKYLPLHHLWGDESKATKIRKGILVILSLVVPWLPLILMGVWM